MKLGVSKKISKLPSRKGLQKNHAQHNENQKHLRGEAFSGIYFFFPKHPRGEASEKKQSYLLGEASRKIMSNFTIFQGNLL